MPEFAAMTTPIAPPPTNTVLSAPVSEARHEGAERLLLQFARFGSGVTRSMAAATDEPDFVTNAPLVVLCLLDPDGPSRPGVIAELVGLTSGGTTKLLDRMEAAGLLCRTYGAIHTDRRGVQVESTARGRTLLRHATAALLAHLPDAAATVKGSSPRWTSSRARHLRTDNSPPTPTLISVPSAPSR